MTDELRKKDDSVLEFVEEEEWASSCKEFGEEEDQASSDKENENNLSVNWRKSWNRFDALIQWQKLLNIAAKSATAKNDNYMSSLIEEFIKAQNNGKLKTRDKDFRNARDVHGNALVHYLAKHNFHLCFQNPRIVHLKTDSNLEGNNATAPVHLVLRYGVDRVTTEHLVTAILNSMNNPLQQDKFGNIVLHHSILNRDPELR